MGSVHGVAKSGTRRVTKRQALVEMISFICMSGVVREMEVTGPPDTLHVWAYVSHTGSAQCSLAWCLQQK